MAATSQQAFNQQLKKYYGFYTGGFILFIIVLAILEQMGISNRVLGYIFLLATIGLYAGIGIMSRTADVAEYYVAGRRVPAFFNGMATGADWMSAASFIGMAGTLYLEGFDGLAYIMGWTGGYCLVALLLAPCSRFRTFWGHVTTSISRAPSACSRPSSRPSSTWWRRSTAWVSSPAASPAWSSASGCSSAWPAFWCAPSWEACAP
jgi:hypothetical protein